MAQEDNKTVVHNSYGEASAAEVQEIMDACYAAKMNLCIVGAPGVGKSKMIDAWTLDRFGTLPWILIGSQMAPEDVLGLPARSTAIVNGEEVSTTEYGMNIWERDILEGKCKVLFLDEFSNTPRAVGAALLSMLSSRRFPDGRMIPDDVMIIMAMNDEATAADYNELSAPMANRICFVSYKPSDEEVYEGLVDTWFSDDEKAAWTDVERQWRDRIVGFLRQTNGAYILNLNDIGEGDADTEDAAWNPEMEYSSAEREILTTAWCSPRSWDNVARVLANTPWDQARVTPLQERILNGTVGRQATISLMEYVAARNRFDPFDLIRNPELIEWDVGEDDTEFNELVEIAQSINHAVSKCDGLDGRPDAREALGFYRKVLDLGGGPLFANAISQDANGPRKHLNRNMPADVNKREWRNEILDVVIAYGNAELVPKNV